MSGKQREYDLYYSTDWRFFFLFLFQFNFVGRILGPRGMTAKQLELETGCKIMVRGKGSMRDKKKVSLSAEKRVLVKTGNKLSTKSKKRLGGGRMEFSTSDTYICSS